MLPGSGSRPPRRLKLVALARRVLSNKIVRTVCALAIALRLFELVFFPGRFTLWDQPLRTGWRLPGTSGREDRHDSGRPQVEGLDRVPAQPMPLCVVTAWERGALPDYVRASLDSFGTSARRRAASGENRPFADLYLFIPSDMTVDAVKQLYGGTRAWPSNVHVVDIGDVHWAWRRGGWPRFVADQFCRLHGLRSNECREMKSVVQKKFDRGENLLVNLRPMYGDLFEPWVNARRCSSWAWADLDTLWGDIGGLLDAPLVQERSDVFTISYGDANRLYTRGQFTGFNQRKTPDISSVWRSCVSLKDFSSTIDYLKIEGWTALDEGCTTDAVLRRNLTLTVLPLQQADWDATIVRFDRGVLTTCMVETEFRGERARERCRERMKHRTDALLAAAHPRRISPLDHQPDGPAHPLALTRPANTDSSCAFWLPPEVTYCPANTSDPVIWDRSDLGVVIVDGHGGAVAPAGPPARIERYPYPTAYHPRDVPDADPPMKVIESVVFHMQNWKKRLTGVAHPLNLGVVALRAGNAVIEIFDDVEGNGEGRNASRGVVMRVVPAQGNLKVDSAYYRPWGA